jgi:trehalose-6-phosphate synthase
VWTAERLRAYVNAINRGDRIVVLSNREPFSTSGTARCAIKCRAVRKRARDPLEPLVQACSGVWVAHGAGTVDRAVVDRRDGLDVPPANLQYSSAASGSMSGSRNAIVTGFANEALWPPCHRAHVQRVFRLGDFNTYCAVK